jgi:hypothetical protein
MVSGEKKPEMEVIASSNRQARRLLCPEFEDDLAELWLSDDNPGLKGGLAAHLKAEGCPEDMASCFTH